MKRLKEIKRWSAFPSLVLLILFIIINAIISRNFRWSFFQSFILTNMSAICVTIGVTATLLVKGTDISLGSIVSLVNVVIVTLSGKGVQIEYAALIGILVGIACGIINGTIVAIMRVNPLLTTFATSIAFSGIALWILPYPGGSTPSSFGDWYMAKQFGFLPTPMAILLLLVLIWYFFMKLPLGKQLYALGNDEKKAYASGINVTGIKFFVHCFAGFASGLAGVCITANICAGSPTIGSVMSMNSIAAAVIGGVSLNGGIGSIWGGVFGAAFLKILTSIVVAANLSSYVQSLIQGLILLLGVAFAVFAGRKEWKVVIRNKVRGVGKHAI